MGCGGRSHKLGFLLSLQWVCCGFLVGLRWIFVGLQWVWVSGDWRRLADLEVVSRWCSFAVVRGLRNKLRGGAGLHRSEPRSRGGVWLRRFVDRFLSLAVEICWSVVAGGGVLLKLWLDFVGLWWVLQWVKMWLPVVVLL